MTHIRSIESKLPIVELTHPYCNFRTEVHWMTVTCFWWIKYLNLKIGPSGSIPVFKGFALKNFTGAGPFPHFFLSCAIHQSINGKYMFTRLFNMYDLPNKMASSKASVRVSLLTRRCWTEFRAKKVVLYSFSHYRVVEWNGER